MHIPAVATQLSVETLSAEVNEVSLEKEGSGVQVEETEAPVAGEGAEAVAAPKKKKKPKKKKGVQTEPPTILVEKLFPTGVFPEGEIQNYKDDNTWRITSEEKRYLERMENDMYQEVR
jgi:methionyl aminopeptidase